MNHDEYIARISDLLPVENIPKLLQLNNEAIGETDIQVRGITQNKENPMYWTKGTKVDYELRQELRNMLAPKPEQGDK